MTSARSLVGPATRRTPTGRLARVGAVAAALAAFGAVSAGCGADAAHRTTVDSRGSAAAGSVDSSPSATRSGAAGSADRSGPLALRHVTTIRVSGSVGPVRLGEENVVYPFTTDAHGSWNQVGVAALDSAQPRVVATSAWPHGLINWVASTGDWIAYVDQSAEQSDSHPEVLWRIWAVDTSTGQKVRLATNGQQPDAFVPIVLGREGSFYWTSAEADRTARESIWQPGWAAPKDVLRHTEMTPGSETLVGDRLIYLGPNGAGRSGHTVGGDCWSVPVTGGDPEPLTHTALALGCAAAGNSLVWSQHVERHPATMPAAGLLDDPYTVWSQPLDGGQPTRLERGYILSSPPLAGDGFASWDPDGRRVVRSLTSERQVRLPAGGYGVTGDASGRRLAYTTGRPGTAVTIHVDEVTGH